MGVARACAVLVLGSAMGLVGGPVGTTGPASTAMAAGGRPASRAGAVPLGSARYSIPSRAVFVSPYGSDRHSGSASSPVRTIQHAVDAAPYAGTVVLRRGTYHESVNIGAPVTVQNYPGETVWLDGSTVVTGWVRSGSVWVKTGWRHRFDSSPSFSKGVADGTKEAWRFLRRDHPMAAHPDQVFVNGKALRQVARAGGVHAGTFYVDRSRSRLVIGSDPRGREVRASSLAKAISVRAPSTALRGFGVRRFANSIWYIGAVTLEKSRDRVENLYTVDNATIGLGITARDATVSRVTSRRNGLLGMVANAAYGLRLSSSRVSRNNDEYFNPSPAAGGLKITRSRDVRVANSTFSHNHATGLWLDESVYDADVVGNNSTYNGRHGISFEISSTARFIDNLVLRNHGYGIKVNNANQVRLWNNTIAGNNRPINIVQDPRRGTQRHTAGHDPQRPNPDSTMPWRLRDIDVSNNVLRGGSADCLVCVEDYSRADRASDMRLTLRSNFYNRPGGAPHRFAIWSRGGSSPKVFYGLSAFRRETRKDAGSVLADGSTQITNQGRLRSSPRVSLTPLSASIASAAGRRAGSRALGAWLG